MTVNRGVTWLARGGYAARGLVYVIVGGLAIAAALGSGQAVGAEGALRSMLGERFGSLLLWIILLGLFCFSAWRLTQALGDTDSHGRDPKGLLIRTGLLGSAAAHLLLALFTLGLLLDGLGTDSSGGNGKDGLQRLLAWDHANLLVYAVALVPLGVGVAHLIKAWTLDFTRYFQADEQVMRWVRPLSRIGLTARGCAFLIIAALLFFGGRRYRPTDPPGLEEALEALQGLPAGTWLLLAIGLGLLSFALYSFAQARWRRIDLAAVMPGHA
ncbi:MAG: DUF1206 domain-containing protein [Pseudomonadota bacterium]